MNPGYRRHFAETALIPGDVEANGYGDGSFDPYPQVIEGLTRRLDLDSRTQATPSKVSILDVGCGTGRILKGLQPRVANARGVDVEPAMVRRCKDAGLDVQVSRAAKLPFEDKSFDVVLIYQVLVNFPSLHEVSTAIAEGWRVVKPGGSLLVGALVRPESGFPRHSGLNGWRTRVGRMIGRSSLKCYSLSTRGALRIAARLAPFEMQLLASTVDHPSWAHKYDLIMRKAAYGGE